MGVHQHRHAAPASVGLGILSVSTTRAIENDESGQWMVRRAKKEGHDVRFHQVVSDEVATIRDTVLRAIRNHGLRALLVTGGTGLTPTDVTIEAIKPLFAKEMTAFGAIFAQLSYEAIDSAAILSRATAGVIGSTAVYCMPGSKKACQLACRALIFPELGHVVAHIQ